VKRRKKGERVASLECHKDRRKKTPIVPDGKEDWCRPKSRNHGRGGEQALKKGTQQGERPLLLRPAAKKIQDQK